MTLDGSDFLKFWSDLRPAGEELDIVCVEEQLEMFRVQTKLTEIATHLACQCVIG